MLTIWLLFSGWSAHYFWAGPLEASAVLVVGCLQLGPAFASGWLLLLALVPLQSSFGRQFGVLRASVAVETDKRMRLTSQALGGARLIKISGWEQMFAEKICKVRREELKGVVKASSLRATNEAIFFTSATLVAFATFAVHVCVLKRSLSAAQVFVTLALFNVCQLSVTKFIMLAVEYCSACKVSFERIQKFLELEDAAVSSTIHQRDVFSKSIEPTEPDVFAERMGDILPVGDDSDWESAVSESDGEFSSRVLSSLSADGVALKTTPVLSVEELEASWLSGALSPVLSGISLECGAGECVAVVGPVGCGKSSLLLAILGEMPSSKSSGRAAVRICASHRKGWWKKSTGEHEGRFGRVAYCSQEAFILSGTVRENIIFGDAVDELKYQKVRVAVFHLLTETCFHVFLLPVGRTRLPP